MSRAHAPASPTPEGQEIQPDGSAVAVEERVERAGMPFPSTVSARLDDTWRRPAAHVDLSWRPCHSGPLRPRARRVPDAIVEPTQQIADLGGPDVLIEQLVTHAARHAGRREADANAPRDNSVRAALDDQRRVDETRLVAEVIAWMRATTANGVRHPSTATTSAQGTPRWRDGWSTD